MSAEKKPTWILRNRNLFAFLCLRVFGKAEAALAVTVTNRHIRRVCDYTETGAA